MALVFILLLAAVSVFAVPKVEDLEYTERVIGGERADIREFPFMVALLYLTINTDNSRELKIGCGGAIITQDWVLTSASCATKDKEYASGATLQLYSVKAGSSHSDKGGMERRVVDTASHKDPEKNNIALIKVDQPWPLSTANIRVALLPQQGEDVPTGSHATIMGWGYRDLNRTRPAVLMKAVVDVLSDDTCQNILESSSKSSRRHICTAVEVMKIYSLYWGDRGGPVMWNGEVVGISVYFDDDDPTSIPKVHMRVSAYIDWIEKIVGPVS